MIINMTGGGGGAALNFKVVPGLTQPGTASENTIWVKTEEINNWYFSATKPEGLQKWDVWFTTGTKRDFAFNALRKNGLQVYPLSAKQMVSGALVDVESMIYQGGEWLEWITYLFNNGDLCEDITGGWTSDGFTNSSSSFQRVNATIGNTLKLSAADGKMCLCGTANKVKFGENNTTLKITVTEKTGTNGIVYLSSTKDISQRILNSSLSAGDNAVDISTVDGYYYVIFLSSGGAANLVVSAISY